jgi:phospholipid/cholesterol/gamma-HCH transport system substrate-binding protein
LIDGGDRVRVDFNVDRSLPLFDETTASIRYLNLIATATWSLGAGTVTSGCPPKWDYSRGANRACSGPDA